MIRIWPKNVICFESYLDYIFCHFHRGQAFIKIDSPFVPDPVEKLKFFTNSHFHLASKHITLFKMQVRDSWGFRNWNSPSHIDVIIIELGSLHVIDQSSVLRGSHRTPLTLVWTHITYWFSLYCCSRWKLERSSIKCTGRDSSAPSSLSSEIGIHICYNLVLARTKHNSTTIL